ncbi:hypothetical protein, partial [Bernardetia sp.]|uniref:hypothetical protein n=1 Tax=Bernardetia sp. TaxID=1937974 RepID=UPI0025C0136B
MKTIVLLTLSILLFGCSKQDNNKIKVLDTGLFTIEVPSGWEYKEKEGIDSFVGEIHGKDIILRFDAGIYTSRLVLSEEEYINDSRNWIPDFPYYEEGVIYTSGGVEGTRKIIMEEKGITDTSLVIVKKFPTPLKDT